MYHRLTTLLMTAGILAFFSGKALCLDVAVISSSDIIPYMDCVEGIREALDGHSLFVATIDQDLERGKRLLSEIAAKKPRLIIAVGPRAAFLLGTERTASKQLFCMVLNPKRLLGEANLYGGVSLNIEPSFQIDHIKQAFPDRKKIGVFYSSLYNKTIIGKLTEAAARHGLRIVPFAMNSPNDISQVIESEKFSIDVLLVIPDDLLRSTKIVEYIIRESLLRKIPVVGYNSWFARNGSILSFVVDYRRVGKQTGTRAAALLNKEGADTAGVKPPEAIALTVDLKTAGKLGVAVAPAIIERADEVLQ